METKTVNFPATIRFLAYKQPAINVFCTEEDGTALLKWEQSKENVKIISSELTQFINDTDELVENYAVYFAEFLTDTQKKPFSDVILKEYWKKWGPLSFIKSKGGHSQISLTDILALSWSCYLLKLILQQVELQKLTGLTERFFYKVEEMSTWNKRSKDNNKIPTPKYWCFVPKYLDGYYIFEPSPYFKKHQINQSSFLLYIKHPPNKVLDNLSFLEKKIEWLKESVMQCLADYITRQRLSFRAVVDGNEMHFVGETKNLLLAYIVNGLLKIGRISLEYCKCGCGRIVPPSREKYYDDKCMRRAIEQKTERKITNLLSTWRSRGKISQEMHTSLLKDAYRMLTDDIAYEEIRNYMRKRIKGGK